MGEFTGELVVEVIPNSRRPFRVFREFEFHSGLPDSGLLLRCEEGFEFDGTSIPWLFRWLLSPSDPALLQSAAGHDKIHRTGTLIIRVDGVEREVPVHRDVANAMMAEMMIAKNVVKWKRNIINPALAVGSGPAWRRSAKQRNSVRTDTTR